MSKKDYSIEMSMVQQLVDIIRKRESADCGMWPGRKKLGDPAITRYPNLCAEIVARGYCLCTPAEHALITANLLAAVIEDGDELTDEEIIRLSKLFDCPIFYLLSPVLSKVSTGSNKGNLRVYELQEQFRRLYTRFSKEELSSDGFYYNDLKRAKHILRELQTGSILTYADYRKSKEAIKDIFQYANDMTVPIRGRA